MDSVSTSAALQDLGAEFGCPAGIRITQWLRGVLRQAREDADAIAEMRIVLAERQYPEGQTAERAAEWLREHGWTVTPPAT